VTAAELVGIDLGTAWARVATYGEAGPRILEDDQGRRALPAAVSFRADHRVLVGAAARRHALLAPRATVRGAVRLIGRRWDSPETQRVREASAFDVVQAPTGEAWVRAGTSSMSPSQVQAALLQALAAAAAQELGVPVTRAVVTVPAGFDDAQRKATLDAGALASLEIVRLLDAPTAAALGYAAGHPGGATIAVVDAGAGCTEAAIVRCEDGLVESLAVAGDLFLGGDDYDRRLASLVRDELYALHDADLAADPIATQRVLDEVEAVRCALSSADDATIALPHLTLGPTGPVTLIRPLARADLDTLTADLTRRIGDTCRAALAAARLEAGDLDAVVAVGGVTRTPAVAEAIAAAFGRPPSREVHRDEAIALGAAIEAAVIAGRVSDLVVVDRAGQTIGLRAAGDKLVPVIRRGAAIPARVRKLFATSPDPGKRVIVELYQGEDPVASRNRRLGRFELTDRASPRGEQVELVVTVDASGCAAITARDPKTGRPWSVEPAIRSGTD
jgi:molecular chaperone DnaK